MAARPRPTNAPSLDAPTPPLSHVSTGAQPVQARVRRRPRRLLYSACCTARQQLHVLLRDVVGEVQGAAGSNATVALAAAAKGLLEQIGCANRVGVVMFGWVRGTTQFQTNTSTCGAEGWQHRYRWRALHPMRSTCDQSVRTLLRYRCGGTVQYGMQCPDTARRPQRRAHNLPSNAHQFILYPDMGGKMHGKSWNG